MMPGMLRCRCPMRAPGVAPVVMSGRLTLMLVEARSL